MTRTIQHTPAAVSAIMATLANRPIGLEEMVNPLAEVMAADDDPRATLREIITLLVRQSNQLKNEAKNCLREVTC